MAVTVAIAIARLETHAQKRSRAARFIGCTRHIIAIARGFASA
jgi:hypothetical protein